MAESGGLVATRAIVTRALEQAGSLSRGLEEIGIEVILSPAIRFEEPRDWSAFDRAAEGAAAWDWVILTSANGVKFATRRLGALGRRWSGFSGARFAAIGPATARALAGEGVEAGRPLSGGSLRGPGSSWRSRNR